jgi:hypothetical protein
VEGYAGSAIQLALLEHFQHHQQQHGLSTIGADLSDHLPTMVFFHALNPVGMKEYRRCNENNVDLNRNCMEEEDFESTLIGKRDPNIGGYEDFRNVWNPKYDDSKWFFTIGIWISLIPKLLQHGYLTLKRSMVAGQYHHPEGLFYGGSERQVSIQQLLQFLDSRPDLFAESPFLLWIDVHTGLGPFGKDSLHYHTTTSTNSASRLTSLTAKEFQERFFSNSFSVTGSFEENKTSNTFQGYDLTAGMLTSFLARYKYKDKPGVFFTVRENLFIAENVSVAVKEFHCFSLVGSLCHNAIGCFAVSQQEFGTLPGILMGRAFILDNMLYQQHQKDQTQEKDGGTIEGRLSYRSSLLKYAFYPQSAEWRKNIVQRGVAMMLHAIQLCKSEDTIIQRNVENL